MPLWEISRAYVAGPARSHCVPVARELVKALLAKGLSPVYLASKSQRAKPRVYHRLIAHQARIINLAPNIM
jgi:hypothetical protein